MYGLAEKDFTAALQLDPHLQGAYWNRALLRLDWAKRQNPKKPDLTNALAEGALEHGGLVHIIPGAADTHIHERLLHVTPPLAYLWPRVIREDRVIGPDVAVEHRAIGLADEHVTLHPCPVDLVIGIALHAGVDDRHDAEAIAA